MKYLLMIILFSYSSLSFASGADSLFQKGAEMLAAEKFNEARTHLQSLVEQEPSFATFYNLGIAYARLNEWNHSRWAFESALKYKPMSVQAQFNAQYAMQQLNPQLIWQHPYAWYDRFVLGVGISIWFILSVTTSLFMGFYVFQRLTRGGQSKFKKWMTRLLPFAICVFIFSFYNLSIAKKHFEVNQYAIASRNELKLYLSPQGIEVNETINYSERYKIIEYSEDSTWIRILSSDNRDFWVKSKEMIVY